MHDIEFRWNRFQCETLCAWRCLHWHWRAMWRPVKQMGESWEHRFARMIVNRYLVDISVKICTGSIETFQVSHGKNYINNFIYDFLWFFYDFTTSEKNQTFSDMFFLWFFNDCIYVFFDEIYDFFSLGFSHFWWKKHPQKAKKKHNFHHKKNIKKS